MGTPASIRVAVRELTEAGLTGPWSNRPPETLIETPIEITEGNASAQWRLERGLVVKTQDVEEEEKQGKEEKKRRYLVPDEEGISVEAF